MVLGLLAISWFGLEGSGGKYVEPLKALLFRDQRFVVCVDHLGAVSGLKANLGNVLDDRESIGTERVAQRVLFPSAADRWELVPP